MALKIIFMGTPEFAVPILQSLKNSQHKIIKVYTQPPKKKDRGQKIHHNPIHEFSIQNNLEIRHLSKSAVSDCSFKAVTRGSSNVSFKGKVFVDENCSDTQSNQISKGLLIDEESKINLTPILEINNDDVVCSHGAASGKADEEVLFYLASRGISKSEAERIYIQGFLSEFIEKIEDAEMQAKGQNFINENC